MEKSSLDSELDLTTVFVPPGVKERPVVGSLASLDPSVDALEQASR